MKAPVIIAHSCYRAPGGEEAVVDSECQLLRFKGHTVVEYRTYNSALVSLGMVGLARTVLWNSRSYDELGRLIEATRPALVHFHNTFPSMSPSVYYVARRFGIPVVQTVHNFRLLCVNANLFREGRVCEDCVGKVPWRGAMRGCYRGSRASSVVVASMLTLHRVLRTWRDAVEVYIALSEFSRQKLIMGGLPADKVVVKPNCVSSDPGFGGQPMGYALFVGRLSAEKGIGALVVAWQKLCGRVPLKVVGDGPDRDVIEDATRRLPNVEWLGPRTRSEVVALMKEANFLVVPSGAYENFPVTIAEAFSVGLPVIASGHGSLCEVVEDLRTGLHFRPGDPEHLADRVEWAWEHPAELAEMRREARAEYETKYTAARNYQMLMEIYQRAGCRGDFCAAN